MEPRRLLIASCAFSLALVCLAWAWLPFGLDHFDQGYVLSAGKLLFEHPQDVVPHKTGGYWLTLLPIAVLMEMGGDYGALLVRLAAVPVALAITVAGCFLVRRRMSLPVLVAAGGFSHLVARSWRVDGFLSYPLLSAFGLALAIVFLVEGSDRRRRSWLVAGGAILAANVFVRLPNLAGLALLALPAAWELLSARGLAAASRQSAWAVLGSLAGAAAVLGIMASLGHVGFFVTSLTGLLSMAQAADSPYKPSFLLAKMGLDICLALALTAPLLFMAKLGDLLKRLHDARWWRSVLIAAGGVLGAVVFLADRLPALLVPYGLVFVVLLGSLVRRDATVRDRVIDAAAFAMFLLVPLGAAAGVGMGAAVGALFAGPVAISRIVEALTSTHAAGSRPFLGLRRVSAGIIALALLVAAVTALPTTSRDLSGYGGPYGTLRSVRLPGIFMDPARVALYDELMPALEKHAAKDAFLLAFPNVPLLYFLSGRRPYLAETWPSLRTPTFVRRQLAWAKRERGELPVVVRARGFNLNWAWPKPPRRRVFQLISTPKWLVDYITAGRRLHHAGLHLLGFQSLSELQNPMIKRNELTLGKFLFDERYTRVWRGKTRFAFEILLPPE